MHIVDRHQRKPPEPVCFVAMLLFVAVVSYYYANPFCVVVVRKRFLIFSSLLERCAVQQLLGHHFCQWKPEVVTLAPYQFQLWSVTATLLLPTDPLNQSDGYYVCSTR